MRSFHARLHEMLAIVIKQPAASARPSRANERARFGQKMPSCVGQISRISEFEGLQDSSFDRGYV